MSWLIALFYIAIMLSLLSTRRQAAWRRRLGLRPALIFLAVLALGAVFLAVLAIEKALKAAFAVLLLAYLLTPTALIYGRRQSGRRLDWRDLGAVLLLWLPVEFTLCKSLLPAHVHGVANEAAQGTATVTALLLLVIFRAWPDHKYCWPRRSRDFLNALAGFAVLAVPLGVLGRLLGFLGPFGPRPGASPLGFLRLFVITLLGVAIPEELLFRSLIQTWLLKRLGDSWRGLVAAAVVFGAAHLDNGPGPLPNWSYMILATMAGFGYGVVFQRSSSVLASASLHALVNTVRHTFFG
ncbi:MAG: type II CAAX prenyl endopeptidase Rce1 family protein [Bryobacteraceae bacterium]